MLRVLHLDNWKSFSEPVDFTMIAGKETRHGETLYLGSKNRVLPVAAIYGANAAGKWLFRVECGWRRLGLLR